MIDIVTVHQQIVGDDPTVAPPPDRFGTHQRQALVAAQMDQLAECSRERIAHRVIGVVVKALNPPKCVGALIHVRLLTSPATERGTMPIADLHLRQIVGQGFNVERWIGTRSWEGPNVDQKGDLSVAQHPDQFIDGAIRVPDGEKEWHSTRQCRYVTIYSEAIA